VLSPLGWPGFGEITLLALLALLLAALVAGVVDAVVGGGGLVQLPALLLLLPGAPVLALASNKVASVVGTTAATITYARGTRVDWRAAALMAGTAFGGSVGGAAFAGALPATVLRVVVLVAVLGVGIYTLRTPHLGSTQRLRFGRRAQLVLMATGGAVIGGYDGLAGPGTGSFLVFLLVGAVGYAFLHASATAKLVNVATNLGALAYFVPAGHVVWGLALCMAVANLLGATLGARVAVRRGSAFVRRVFLVVVAVLVVSLTVQLVASA
jgi:uncharacterized membrane protein YfcA